MTAPATMTAPAPHVANPMDGQPVQPMRAVTGISREQFTREIQPAARPVVLRGVAAHWPAVEAGRSGSRALADYLLRFDTGAPMNVMVGDPAQGGRYFYTPGMDGFNFSRRQAPARAALDTMTAFEPDGSRPYLYAGATSANNVFRGFGEANTLDLVPEGTPPLAWVGNPSRIAPHYDISENIAVCVHGRRQFMLFPPEQVSNLYIGPWENTPAGPECSLVDIREPDLDAHPRYAEARANALLADLHPGDAVYIPPLWWHTVEARGDFNLLVNYWWSPHASHGVGMGGMAHTLLTLRDLPQSQKDAWRAFFDHYIFSDDAHTAADHIPKAAQGVRGERTPRRDQMIRQFIKSML